MSASGRRLAAYFDKAFLCFLETLPDAMVLSDHDGRIVLVNANTENLFGYHRDELVGKKVEMLVPPRQRARHRQHRTVYYADPSSRLLGIGRDLRACHKDGTEFSVEISLSPLEIKGDLFVWSAIRSITERERLLKDLRAVLSDVRVFGGMLSICAWCKKIRDERGSWQPLESYIESRSETKFTHGLCEDCLQKLNPLSKACKDSSRSPSSP
jgi:PAS domain S-box-containing protein